MYNRELGKELLRLKRYFPVAVVICKLYEYHIVIVICILRSRCRSYLRSRSCNRLSCLPRAARAR